MQAVGECGYCAECGAPCQAIAMKDGIGRYEYCGLMFWDEEIVPVSPCCEAPVLSLDEYRAMCEEANQ